MSKTDSSKILWIEKFCTFTAMSMGVMPALSSTKKTVVEWVTFDRSDNKVRSDRSEGTMSTTLKTVFVEAKTLNCFSGHLSDSSQIVGRFVKDLKLDKESI